MKYFGLLMVGIFASAYSYAQFNDSTFYMVRYGVTGIINRTNEASSYAINNGLRFSISKKKVALNSNSSWVYGQQQKQLTNNDFNIALDVNWYPQKRKFYYWGLTTYETSLSLKVNNRTQAGAGGAYIIADKKDFFINVSDGILYEFADLKLTETSNDVYSTFRNSFRLRLRYVFNERITIESTSFLQNSLEQKTDYIINTNTSVLFRLFKWVSLTSSLKYNKVNRNNRENLLITFGLTAEKYF